MEAAAVDGACRPDLRPDRLRRDRRRTRCASRATASTGTRRAATSSSSRSTTSRFANIGSWPWPRRYHAELVDRLTAAQAPSASSSTSIFPTPPMTPMTARFAEALKRSGHVTLLATRTMPDPSEGPSGRIRGPCPMFARHAKLGSDQLAATIIRTRFGDFPMRESATARLSRRSPPLLANAAGAPGRTFRLDYSIDPDSRSRPFPRGDVLQRQASIRGRARAARTS